eukprot:7328964-Alexandrium_andersonii.AAC.1
MALSPPLWLTLAANAAKSSLATAAGAEADTGGAGTICCEEADFPPHDSGTGGTCKHALDP